ncbi:MAG TPA: hypothetical protein VHH15_04945 [Actinophytocola sp.]|nr:hypothetical protein [Actinophytocola sp.]
MTQLGHFEQNLLTELREVVADQAAARRPRRSPARRLVPAAAGAGLLAAGLLVGLPALDGEQARAAYAIDANDDGTITVTVDRLEDADGLERQLAAHGVSAVIDYVPPGQQCRQVPRRFEPMSVTREWVDMSRPDIETDSEFSVTLRPALFEDKTLIIEAMRAGDGHSLLFVSVTAGPVAPCVLVDAG